MKNIRDKKALFYVLLIIVGFLTMIIVPFVVYSIRKDRIDSFPQYTEITIDKSSIVNSTYDEVKRKLESDYYFKREAYIDNYDYENFDGSNLKNMIWNFIFSYELNNTKYMTNINYDSGTFCMKAKDVVDAFKELYVTDITNSLDYFAGYHEYVTHKNNKYCFNFRNVSYDHSNNILIGIDNIYVENDVITTDLYVYEYYTTFTERENKYVSLVKNYINNYNLTEAGNIIKKNLNGEVKHKKVSFKLNKYGKHFKYQILSSKNID